MPRKTIPKRHFILCYDITDKKRLNKLQHYVSTRFIQLQRSVYYASLTLSQVDDIIKHIKAIVNHRQDDVRLYEIWPPHTAWLNKNPNPGLMLCDDKGMKFCW